MKLKTELLVLFSVTALVFGGSCAKTGSPATDDDTTTDESADSTAEDEGIGATIANEISALARIPSADPSSMDYSLESGDEEDVLRVLGVRHEHSSFSNHFGGGGDEFGGEDSGLRAKIVHQEGDGLGTFNVYLCRGTTQIGYANYNVVDDVYTSTVLYRETSDWGQDDSTVDIVSTLAVDDFTSEEFSGSVDFKFNSEARLVLSADGATQTNALMGAKDSHAVSCKWNATLGCASYEGLISSGEIPFALSVDPDTGAKIYAESEDNSLCTELEFTTVAENATIGDDETWDCEFPAETEPVEIESAMGLENAGGEHCQSASDAWEEFAANDPTDCAADVTAEAIGCFCDSLYSKAVQKIRRAERQFTCKIKGVFALVESGELEGVSFEDSDTVYLDIASIFGGGD